MTHWQPLSEKAEADLRARLDAAEQVCILMGGCALQGGERADAATQAWMDWRARVGNEPVRDVAPERVRFLAQRRRDTEAASVARLRDQGLIE